MCAAILDSSDASQAATNQPGVASSTQQQLLRDTNPAAVALPVVAPPPELPPPTPVKCEAEVELDATRHAATLKAYGVFPPMSPARELLPAEVNRLPDELGGLDKSDLFLDSGSGVGNIVAHVAVGTKAYKAIGIDFRRDILHLGMKMMASSEHFAYFGSAQHWFAKM
ncbi:unnamed protein product [Phytophthora lilii]|uniref:Unnamed protein product n=1 Tax=Phytophthora lilii TaxID=2077276 RepID=A0A9W6XEY4_9STRA|nr:unnamed protein product [Phytophthora lilii]